MQGSHSGGLRPLRCWLKAFCVEDSERVREGDRRTGNLPPAEVLPKERLAQRLRYCRIMPMKRRNAPAWTPGQGETAPWTARFDGFVKHRNLSSIISYSILATQRSDSGSTCTPVVPGAYVPYYCPK